MNRLLKGEDVMELHYDFMLRLLIAGAMGVCIGVEREYRAKEAGYRTHFLVALGSALLMIVSQYGFSDVLAADLVRLDPSRIAAQVVSGIGFIGAGTIILQKQIVRGLTTAAGIWATSGIGLAIGAGMYGVGIAATVLVLLGLEALSFFFKSMGLRNMIIEFTLTDKDDLKRVTSRFHEKGFIVVSYEMTESASVNGEIYQVSMTVKAKHMNEEALLLMFLNEFPGVTVTKLT
jgi:putative Mg2+ transporter-C (MgtC) family protein